MSTFSEEVSPIIPQYETEEPSLDVALYTATRHRQALPWRQGARVPEAAKWAASLVLWLKFAVTFQFAKGNKLVLFRWNVTKGLLAMNNCNEA